jgi:hypothetical protein
VVVVQNTDVLSAEGEIDKATSGTGLSTGHCVEFRAGVLPSRLLRSSRYSICSCAPLPANKLFTRSFRKFTRGVNAKRITERQREELRSENLQRDET